MAPARAVWQGTIEIVIVLQVLYGKVLHGPCRGCVAKVLWKLWLPCRYYMAKYCMAPAGAAWQRCYRNCGRPAGTIWQSTAWPLQGLRGKGTIGTVVALQVLYGKVLHGPCRGYVAKVL